MTTRQSLTSTYPPMTTRHSHYTPQADESLSDWGASQSTRVHTGAMVFTEGIHGAGLTERSHARYNHTTDGAAGAPITSTIAYRGAEQSVELEPGNPATRTSVAAAVRMGLIRPRLGGGFEDSAAQAETAAAALAEPQEAPQADPGAGLFSETEDRAYAQMIDPLPQHAYDGAVASMVAAVAHGHGSEEAAAAQLAEAAGIEPGQAAEMVAAAHAHYSRVVARALAPLGLTGDSLGAAYAYMQAKEPAKLQDAIQRLTHGRDVGGFTMLAHSYLAAGAGR